MRGVILDAKTLGSDIDLQPITKLPGSWTVYEKTETKKVAERISNAEIILTNKVVLNASDIRLAKKLKFISVLATGTDHIELKEASRKNIIVSNVRGWCTSSVTQHTLALLLSLTNKVGQYSVDISEGAWQKSDTFAYLKHPIEEISGKKFGVIGYGELGKSVSRIIEVLGAEILISERKNKPARPGRTSFEETLASSDFLSLHCPLTKENFHMIDKNVLTKMQNHALLINTARGGLINSADLVEALSTGQIGGAGLDVLETEPPGNSEPLLTKDIPNLIISPHIAWSALESRQRLIQQTRENIQNFINGTPVRLVEG
ncbi:MAG: glycerate dehydrogenase [Gammaproteobacteria bacterium]|nr:glycerate dehydrogenase [Gammaproteobacteria bacterium]